MQILNSYVDGNYDVTEYTVDGTNASHIVRVLITPSELPEVPLEPTADDYLIELREQNIIIMEALAAILQNDAPPALMSAIRQKSDDITPRP